MVKLEPCRAPGTKVMEATNFRALGYWPDLLISLITDCVLTVLGYKLMVPSIKALLDQITSGWIKTRPAQLRRNFPFDQRILSQLC